MRIAAGILMVIGAMIGIGILRLVYPGVGGLLFWMLTMLVIFGGIGTLRGRYWRLCLASGSLLTLLLIAGLLFFPGAAFIFLLPGGILPIIFICLRKREWKEFQA